MGEIKLLVYNNASRTCDKIANNFGMQNAIEVSVKSGISTHVHCCNIAPSTKT